jgi:aldose 1-epimerase
MTAAIGVFGHLEDGTEVLSVEIGTGPLKVGLLTWGAVIRDVRLSGGPGPLTLGGPTLAGYRGPMSSFGSLIGPVVNRIRDAEAPIGGRMHRFEANLDGQHTKHGGSRATYKQAWRLIESSPDHALMEIHLPDGLSGFPGNRTIRADYRVTGTRLDMVVIGTTDAPTLMNLANHSYWNLDASDSVAGHLLEIAADRITVNGDDLMVTGEIAPVAGTRHDFRTARRFEPSPENRFDVNYCLSDARRPLSFAARLTGQRGVTMEMWTTEPGLQVFDLGTFDTTPHPGHHGAPYPSFAGIALEAQGWPDAAKHPDWPQIEMTPEQPYHQHTAWVFGPA